MYLRAEKYVTGASYDEEAKGNYDRLLEMFPEAKEPAQAVQFPSARVVFTVGYWRKSNQIHSWFVRECQNGVDECQLTYVSREKLAELREVCLRVLAARSEDVAEELLAPQGGFFFGTTEYGDWYWHDLKETVVQIDRALALPTTWSLYYQSSW